MVKVGKYNYEKSTKPDKKLMVVVEKDGKKRTIHFGARDMGHYFDKTGIWKSKDHGDKDRRRRYKSRHKVYIKSGYYSPGYFSMKFLW